MLLNSSVTQTKNIRESKSVNCSRDLLNTNFNWTSLAVLMADKKAIVIANAAFRSNGPVFIIIHDRVHEYSFTKVCAIIFPQ